jgi:RND family efflux transporter MFP subunit
MRRHFASSAVLYSLLAVFPLALLACGDKPTHDPRTEAPLVRSATVSDTVAATRSFTGTVAARVQSDLSFRVSGKVLERLVDTGQTVKRGQALMRIDPADLQLTVRAQQEAVAAARARATQTADEENRYRDLRGTGAISASAYDQVKAAADAAKAQLSAAQAQAELAANANRYAQLLADADGIVMETLAEPGQVVAAGQAVLRVARAGEREAVIQLPETMRPAAGSSGQGTLYGQDQVTAPARLRQLSNAADRQTRTFEARYVLEGALANAPLGTTVTIKLADADTDGDAALWIPIGALFDAGKGPGVWLIQGDPAKVSWRAVTTRRLSDDGAQVSGALKRGDRIVALGPHLLREGEQVRVATAATTATAAKPPTTAATLGARP